MNPGDAVILGLIQGLTEFLPVSSSGHLAMAGLLGITRETVTTAAAVTLHGGTLAAILVVFRRDILALFNARRDLIWPLFLSTAVTTAVALPLKKLIDYSFQSLIMVGVGLIVTAVLIAAGEYAMRRPRTRGTRVGWRPSVMIGLLQAIAALPGISRSGTTISAGAFAGLDRDAAVKYAFLLGIPAIAGAMVLEAPDMAATEGWGVLAIGFAVAFLTGLAALKLLFRTLQSRYYLLFAVYTLLAGTGLLIYGLRTP
jgi:undecaprenyl-diphosphatase